MAVVEPWLELESDGELEELPDAAAVLEKLEANCEELPDITMDGAELPEDAELEMTCEEPSEAVTVDGGTLEVAVDTQLELNCEEQLEELPVIDRSAAEGQDVDAKLEVNCEDTCGEVVESAVAEADAPSRVEDVPFESNGVALEAQIVTQREEQHEELVAAELDEPANVLHEVPSEGNGVAPASGQGEEQHEELRVPESDASNVQETAPPLAICKVEAISPVKPQRSQPEDTEGETVAKGCCKVQCEADYEDSESDGEICEEDAKTEATEESEAEEATSEAEAEAGEPKEVAAAESGTESEAESRKTVSGRRRRRTHRRRRRHSHRGRSRRRAPDRSRSRRRRTHRSRRSLKHKRRRAHGEPKESDRGQAKKPKLEEAEVADEEPRDDDKKVAEASTATGGTGGAGGAVAAVASQPVGTRSQREVYVGGLFWKEVNKDVIAEAFNTAFESLPDYQQRYGGPHPMRPVLKVHFPREKIQQSERYDRNGFSDFQIYVFVEFSDPLLARSALKLTGLRINQRSVRVKSTAGLVLQGATLDVEPLRQKELLPLRPLDGSQMLLQVWLGGLPMRACRQELLRQQEKDSGHDGDGLESEINAAVLKLPGVRQRYPELQRCIVALRISDCQRYIFAEAATELIAASMVAARQLTLEASGFETITGWPVSVMDAKERAPPPLAPDGSIADPSQVATLAQKAVVDEEDFAERLECEIFMGGTHGLEVGDLWQTLTELLMALPSYQKHYPELSIPIINIRMASAAYAFSRLANARLASTAVALGEMWVGKIKVTLRRPTHSTERDLAEPLDVHRPLPPAPAPLAPPPPPEAQAKLAEEPQQEREPPPTPPLVPAIMPWRKKVHNVWVGNLPGREKILEGMEDDEKSEQKEAASELMKRRLDQRLNELAMAMPGYDLEDGPITRRLTVHSSGLFAFVRVLGDEEFVEEFLDAIENQDFLGKPMRVNWARRNKDEAFWRNKKPRYDAGRRPGGRWARRPPLQLPRGLVDLMKPQTDPDAVRSSAADGVVEPGEPKKIEVDEL